MSDHEHQFPESNLDGTLVAYPCLLCGLSAGDALKQAAEDRASFEADIQRLTFAAPADAPRWTARDGALGHAVLKAFKKWSNGADLQFSVEFMQEVAAAIDSLTAAPSGGARLEQEVCICAAIMFPDGGIVYGHRHHNCIAAAGEMGLDPRTAAQGFITTRHRFVLRVEAAELQQAAGIKSLDESRIEFPNALFSEDLYIGAAKLPPTPTPQPKRKKG